MVRWKYLALVWHVAWASPTLDEKTVCTKNYLTTQIIENLDQTIIDCRKIDNFWHKLTCTVTCEPGYNVVYKNQHLVEPVSGFKCVKKFDYDQPCPTCNQKWMPMADFEWVFEPVKKIKRTPARAFSRGLSNVISPNPGSILHTDVFHHASQDPIAPSFDKCQKKICYTGLSVRKRNNRIDWIENGQFYKYGKFVLPLNFMREQLKTAGHILDGKSGWTIVLKFKGFYLNFAHF